MSAAQIRFLTLWRREVSRFMKIKKQTLGAPLLETFLYVSVFGAALGSRIKELHGIEYIVFVIPGLSTTSSPRRPRRWSCCWPSRLAASCAA